MTPREKAAALAVEIKNEVIENWPLLENPEYGGSGEDLIYDTVLRHLLTAYDSTPQPPDSQEQMMAGVDLAKLPMDIATHMLHDYERDELVLTEGDVADYLKAALAPVFAEVRALREERDRREADHNVRYARLMELQEQAARLARERDQAERVLKRLHTAFHSIGAYAREEAGIV